MNYKNVPYNNTIIFMTVPLTGDLNGHMKDQ